jgi:hypothetical protein
MCMQPTHVHDPCLTTAAASRTIQLFQMKNPAIVYYLHVCWAPSLLLLMLQDQAHALRSQSGLHWACAPSCCLLHTGTAAAGPNWNGFGRRQACRTAQPEEIPSALCDNSIVLHVCHAQLEPALSTAGLHKLSFKREKDPNNQTYPGTATDSLSNVKRFVELAKLLLVVFVVHGCMCACACS